MDIKYANLYNQWSKSCYDRNGASRKTHSDITLDVLGNAHVGNNLIGVMVFTRELSKLEIIEHFVKNMLSRSHEVFSYEIGKYFILI